MAKLDADQIQDVIRRHAAGESMASIGRLYEVGTAAISRIINRAGNTDEGFPDVENEGRIQTYRDNLTWAMNTAGEYSRTKVHPTTCPNNAAWFLYQQALNEPKDFMAKVSQIESKIQDNDEVSVIKRSAKKTLDEITAFLTALDERERLANEEILAGEAKDEKGR
jgi:hypothetical protein